MPVVHRVRTLLVAGGSTAAVVVAAASTGGAARAQVSPSADPAAAAAGVRVVVQLEAGAPTSVRAAVEAAGARVTRDIPLVEGFAATVPAGLLGRLAALPGVRAVSPDRPVRVYDARPQSNATTTSPYRKVVRADHAEAAGIDGEGVTVALVDTGVADVVDLKGRVVEVSSGATGSTSRCYNLSGESGCDDSYGHGTFMAGLIAGDGASSGGTHRGIAPRAKIVSVKVAGRSGASDVSTILAAIQWVVSFRDTYGIDALNLSLGTDSTEPYTTDPLNYAVERAWAAGIVVVVSAANAGPHRGTIAKPADDPWVVTVGATDDLGTPGLGDDRVPDFSSRGPTADGVTKPDLAAPGAHVTSLRSPGSYIEERFPTSANGAYRRGSGTSASAAITSGAVALMLSRRPSLTPDQVKHALRATTRRAASDEANDVGTGLLDAYAAATATSTASANAGLQRSSGRGSLADSRGTVTVQTTGAVPTALTGTQTAQLLVWDPVGFTTGEWTAGTWYTSVHGVTSWQQLTWSGNNWGGNNWGGNNWGGNNWGGHNWAGSSWYGNHDSGSSYGTGPTGAAWYGAWD